MSPGLALARRALSRGWSGRHHGHTGCGLLQAEQCLCVRHTRTWTSGFKKRAALLSKGARARWAWGGGEEPKNNPDLTHSASNLTGLPARWGFACPIFLSIFSRDLMRAISSLGWI